MRFAALAAVVACGCGDGWADPAPAPTVAHTVRSNVLRADYAGSEACGDCHAAIYAAWQRSPMHRMTRLDRAGAIAAPFDGSSLRLGADRATMTERDGTRYVTVRSPDDRARTYRVTKVIGGREREDYVGIEASGGSEVVLPVSYVFATRSWRYKGYSLVIDEHSRLQPQAVWSQTCIGCHNTLPQLSLLYSALAAPSVPGVYPGTYIDNLLPVERSARWIPIDTAGLARAIDAEVVRIGGRAARGSYAATLGNAVRETRQQLDERDFVELGIGCESCHGGAAEHVAAPETRPTFEPTSPLVRVEQPRSSRAQWINRACARCHTLLVNVYPWTWEGGRRTDRVPGGSTVNSDEARDFLLGGCASQMSCATCHDPHAGGKRDARDAICTSCHPAKASAAHTHHAPGAGSACVGCHMPRKNLGLTYELTRYHRIGSPTDDNRVLRDRPLECALCHRDKSVGELVDTMERWWTKRYDRAPLRALYGELASNTIDATLARGKPHEQAVAIAVLGERGLRSDVAKLAPHLAHPYPQVRYFAKRAIEKLTGAPVPIDVGLPAGEIRAQLRTVK